jgi:isopropylmalate/homocitrate/citramalate synthase
MDYGLGVANSLIAAAAGAATIQVTVGGIGERAGNTPLEETVLALETLYNHRTGIRTEQLTPLARLVMELAQVSQPSNRPVTGTRLFQVESGIISTWVRNVRDTDLVEAFPYRPGFVGQPDPELVLGKGSGLDSIAEALEIHGLEATDEERMALLLRVKERSIEKKALLDGDEFRKIADEVLA